MIIEYNLERNCAGCFIKANIRKPGKPFKCEFVFLYSDIGIEIIQSALKLVVWVRGLVFKTDGYSAQCPGFESDSGCWKLQYIRRVILTLLRTLLVPRHE